MNFEFLSAERDKRDFGLNGFELRQDRSPRSVRAISAHQHSPYRNLKVGCDFDVTTVSISRNNRLRRPVSFRQLQQLDNKKIKNIFMFMRYVYTTAQDLEAWSVAVVVEFSQRSNCFKLPVTDSISLHANRWPNSSSSGEERAEPYNPAIPRIPRAGPDELQCHLVNSSDSEQGAFFAFEPCWKREKWGDENGRPRQVQMGSPGG
jgi:hypothetical protein